jgi:hypothetical protein
MPWQLLIPSLALEYEVDLAQSRSRSLAVILGVSVRLKRPKRSKSFRYPSDCQRGKRALKSFALMSRLARFPPKTDTLRHNLDGQKGSLPVEPSSTSDKRDDVLPARCVLAGVPFVILRLGPLPPVASGGCLEVWCFASCQNCLIERTPERTLLIR